MKLTWLKYREIVSAFYRSANTYVQLTRHKNLGGEIKLSTVEVQIIEHILEHSEECRNMKWYAEQIGLSPSSLTHYINALEDQGLIEKFHTADNKKDIILRVSEKGTLAYNDYVDNITPFFEDIFDLLDACTPEDRERFRIILETWANGHDRRVQGKRLDKNHELIPIK